MRLSWEILASGNGASFRLRAPSRQSKKITITLKLCFTMAARRWPMDSVKRMALFAQVVQHGSMSAAARALGMSTSAVSQQVRALEQDAGVALLHRSTRRLALTILLKLSARLARACVFSRAVMSWASMISPMSALCCST